jgi:hypothetical protein
MLWLLLKVMSPIVGDQVPDELTHVARRAPFLSNTIGQRLIEVPNVLEHLLLHSLIFAALRARTLTLRLNACSFMSRVELDEGVPPKKCAVDAYTSDFLILAVTLYLSFNAVAERTEMRRGPNLTTLPVTMSV